MGRPMMVALMVHGGGVGSVDGVVMTVALEWRDDGDDGRHLR